MSIEQDRAPARQITTVRDQDVCDVCGRTLLRGEHTEGFLAGSRRYEVCELCKSRALHEGWLREGALPEYPSLSATPPRGRSLLGRLRRRTPARDLQFQEPVDEAPPVPQTLDDELSLGDWSGERQLGADPAADGLAAGAEPRRAPRAQRSRPQIARRDSAREPRHVRAVPTSADHKVSAAVGVFNRSAHTRTVAGVARSLGAPEVSITPDPERSAVVWAIAAWELCWYRYEVDLSDEAETVRLDAQGYELEELAAHERIANASADDAGRFVLI